MARTLASPININNHPHQLNLFLFGPLKMTSNWPPFAIQLLNCNTICGIRVPAEEIQNNKTLGFKSKIEESVLEQNSGSQTLFMQGSSVWWPTWCTQPFSKSQWTLDRRIGSLRRGTMAGPTGEFWPWCSGPDGLVRMHTGKFVGLPTMAIVPPSDFGWLS